MWIFVRFIQITKMFSYYKAYIKLCILIQFTSDLACQVACQLASHILQYSLFEHVDILVESVLFRRT